MIKLHNLRCFIAIIFLFVLSSSAIAKEQNKKIAVEITQQQSSISTDKKFTTLGFKGIHLGMKRDEVKEVVSSGNGWSFQYGFDVSDEYVFLNSETPVGCKGQGETEECYRIDTVALRFFEDHVIQISLDSPEYTATDMDYYVKGWARFSLQILKKKFGNPSKTNLSIDRFNIFSVQSGYSVQLYEWNRKDETVILAIGSNDFKYYAKIKYINRKASRKIEQEKRKIKSEM